MFGAVYIGPLNKWILVLIFIFAIPLGVWQFYEYLHVRRVTSFPIVEGDIVEREKTNRVLQGGRLSIRVAGTDTIVIANTNRTAMEKLPDRIRFHYSGNATDEVFIIGEQHPLWPALFFLGMPFVLLLLWWKLKGRKGMEGIVE